MAASQKWITDVDPAGPVSRAARRSLDGRLSLVRHYLPLAALSSQRDIEYVHQLRVSTRRASATLSCYADLLPRRRWAWLNKQLKRIRRAAGEARDLDVLLAGLAGDASRPSTLARAALLDRIAQQRRAAQQPIVAVYRRLKKRRFKKRVRRILEKIRWRDASLAEPSLAAAARSELRRVSQPFFAAAAGSLDEIEALHTLRICGKQVRYTLEIFAAAFGPELRDDVYPQVEALQEHLGAINDHAAAIERFTAWRHAWREPLLEPALTDLLEAEQQSLANQRDEFARWWTPQRADRLQAALTRLFETQAAEEGAA